MLKAHKIFAFGLWWTCFKGLYELSLPSDSVFVGIHLVNDVKRWLITRNYYIQEVMKSESLCFLFEPEFLTSDFIRISNLLHQGTLVWLQVQTLTQYAPISLTTLVTRYFLRATVEDLPDLFYSTIRCPRASWWFLIT